MPESFDRSSGENEVTIEKAEGDRIFQSLAGSGVDELYFEKYGEMPDREEDKYKRFAEQYKLTPPIMPWTDQSETAKVVFAALHRQLKRFISEVKGADTPGSAEDPTG